MSLKFICERDIKPCHYLPQSYTSPAKYLRFIMQSAQKEIIINNNNLNQDVLDVIEMYYDDLMIFHQYQIFLSLRKKQSLHVLMNIHVVDAVIGYHTPSNFVERKVKSTVDFLNIAMEWFAHRPVEKETDFFFKHAKYLNYDFFYSHVKKKKKFTIVNVTK